LLKHNARRHTSQRVLNISDQFAKVVDFIFRLNVSFKLGFKPKFEEKPYFYAIFK